ncbi:autotransporter family protein [Pandoraea sputorum]|uniref:Autotransporter domain-containing protein n=2 Tax=Bacteria TaxID=2 RepID=A0A5E5BKH1_9BURK|nr:autotransporter outer membrane beta-barrel domain-containing protein [Pandoraea sputorum]VVE85602.1 autotransporter domain-containing protein [Pandoraea sputorum]
MRTNWLAAGIWVVLGLRGAPAQATEDLLVNDAHGNLVMVGRVFSAQDRAYAYADDNTTPEFSSGVLSSGQKAQTVGALTHWAALLQITPGRTPAILNIGMSATEDDIHAYSPHVFAETAPVGAGSENPTLVQAALQNNALASARYQQAHGEITVGAMDFSTAPYAPSQVPLDAKANLQTIMVHEVAHALGIGAELVRGTTPGGQPSTAFGGVLDAWAAHLHDDNGNAARPGQTILTPLNTGRVDPSAFDIRTDRGYFSGAQVRDVLAGSSMKGLPVRALLDGLYDSPVMSHIELKNSLMSHQSYRNYTAFMEAELAALQDIGYAIDRRNFFGRSYYGDGATDVNDRPFFGRTTDGAAYVANTYNTATQGLGLHLYGSRNTIAQRADLLTLGAGGAGIRVDGQANHLTVLPGTRIYADGANGRGVMFTYGKDHTLVQRGDVQALGTNGVALSFDFGHNVMGDARDYRGSYLYVHTTDGVRDPLLPELDGPLVTQADITGRVAGRRASLFLSESGYVPQINLMRGTVLQGDVLSQYAQRDARGALRLTHLTFGRTPDAAGRATDAPDATFALRFDGHLTGANLSVNLLGGTTEINGEHTVYEVSVAPGATLTGNSTYQLNADGHLTNAGTVAPGGPGRAIRVGGDYTQTPTGRLLAVVSGDGRLSQLVVVGTATLDGTLAIAPQRGWYAHDFSVTSNAWLQASATQGSFATVTALLASPTLTASATALSTTTYRVAVTRAAHAYARYAPDGNSQQVGATLDQLAGAASADLQPLVTALDFSAADGRDVATALPQLTPAAYGAMFTGGLLRERQITDLVAAAQAVGGASAPSVGATTRAGHARTFATTFGTGYWRARVGDMAGASGNTYGVVFGAEQSVGDALDWTLGVHGAVSGQSTRLEARTPGAGTTTALDVGAHARYAPDPSVGPQAFAAVRVGVEDARVDRTVAVNGYTLAPRGTWTGGTASATVGGGWRWRLTPSSSVGAVAATDYTVLYRPSLTEGQGDGARLQLDGTAFTSLRTRVGGEVRLAWPMLSGQALTANLQATWNHEWLGGAVTQRAAFAGAPATTFTTRSEVVSRDSLGVQAGLSYQWAKHAVVGMMVASNVYAAGSADVAGSVSASWRF